ncbi:expressed unknown protein [Seminavis robusta]|uniref:Uncharacterized protein n=1 Tax=Seminavis robusta TaxID=568900 RepID=A0A9N8DH32_9STRA|nr:expressed unknown protein [Seminavis robusta]|eukprot:Sro149_g068470.1 n/a (127) ;mRNA; f:52866-53246
MLFRTLLLVLSVSCSKGFVLLDHRAETGFQRCSSRHHLICVLAKTDEENDSRVEIVEDESYEPQYGVSFIGGDPCGSKYNTDPHDVKVEKPGMPDSMKARIQALADKRKQEEEEKQKRELTGARIG